MPTNKPVAWAKCDMCEDYICNIHSGQHVADCDCPAIDVWAEHEKWPYSEPVTPALITWAAANPFKDDDEED